jgi:hypothetical protein
MSNHNGKKANPFRNSEVAAQGLSMWIAGFVQKKEKIYTSRTLHAVAKYQFMPLSPSFQLI